MKWLASKATAWNVQQPTAAAAAACTTLSNTHHRAEALTLNPQLSPTHAPVHDAAAGHRQQRRQGTLSTPVALNTDSCA
jgi:hypothetical protein